jgi:ZIP family zinc transporter
MAALGALPFGFGRRPPTAWVGASYAVAGGLMLGAGYLLMSRGLEAAPLVAMTGAVVGVGYTFQAQRYAGLDRPLMEEGYKAILQNTLHAASEGVAIGAAMAVEMSFGIFLALALALHNVSEGVALTELLEQRGIRPIDGAGLCVVTNISQPLLAIVTFALMPAFGSFEPAVLGFAAGALLFLVLTELAPASYERTSTTAVAFLLATASAAIIFFEAILISGRAS